MTLSFAPDSELPYVYDGVATDAAPNRACCYTIDEGYLLPTLLSAFQLRSALPAKIADVVVFCFGSPSDITRAAMGLCVAKGVDFRLVPVTALDGNPMICARFFLPRLLGREYRDVLYVDGDTQVAGSLEPLLTHPTVEGRVLAVPDPMAVMIANADGPWPARRAYFRGIGLHDGAHERYFNSGVMRFQLSDWDAVSRDCLDLCRRNGADYEFRDQDALNLVVGERCDLVSFRWNFPPFFMNFNAQETIHPRLYHFMSNPRPWQGAFLPWGRAWHKPYAALAASHPDLAPTLRSLPLHRYGRYVVQQHVKRYRESRIWGAAGVRTRIDALEASAPV
ncbi:glycosyltransferase family 8 protein [Methylobacterium sp. J-090]|uniref:glycosyltransferase family 8 protein n=1 Tax=Methylobacterium sp. J-090 TaxID=2836666 RepID=UPI001FB9FD98|nr:glycosyltransferase [Methylobacterium sp. J-090]MCJ2082818.1 hypothetical protein [Methylobacterium sp. J-090]